MLEAGLSEQLGTDYAEELAHAADDAGPLGRGGATCRCAPPCRGGATSTRQNIVSYGPHGRANLADIWRRRDLPRDGKAPVLLQVPGGAWMIGWRRPQAYPLMSHLAAAAGCACR